jgi:hypothetical protein
MQKPKLFTQDGDEYREFNDAEYAQYDLDVIEFQRQSDLATAKATARQEILDRLGLTSDEVQLLLS